MSNIQFIQTTPKDLQTAISNEVQSIVNKFLETYLPQQPKEYLTRHEVAKMFQVDISTVHNWCKSGKLKPLGIGHRVYFLREDIDKCLIPLS